MRKTIICIICFFASSSFAATPTITNVTGTVATGQTLTITGTNMMQENNTNWVDLTGGSPNALFKTGTSGTFEGSTITTDGWRNVGNVNGAYDSSVYLAGSHSMRYDVSGGTANGGGATAFGNSASGDYWFRYYVRYSGSVTTWPTDHMKMFGVGTNTGMCYFQFYTPGGVPTQFVATCGAAASTAYGSVPGGSLALGHWYLVEEHMNNSGTLNVWVDNTQVINNYTYASYSGFNYLEPGPINVGSFSGSFSNYFDNLTVSTSRIYASSLIEISNNATYHAGTYIYQSPTYLSDTSIQVTANVTGLGSGPLYLWITNNGQTTSLPYNMSGSPSGDTTPPVTTAAPTSGAYLSSETITLTCTDNVACLSTQYCWGVGCTTPSTYSTPLAIQANTLGYWSTDTSNNVETINYNTYTITSPDTTPPVISNVLPQGTLAYGTTSTTYQETTDKSATCKYDTSDVAYASMANTFTTTGGTSHSQSLTGLTNGSNYTYYSRCVNTSGYADTVSTTATFNVSGTAPTGTTLFTESFEDNNYASRGWYDNTNQGTIVSSGCYSGNCLQWAWTSGQTAPTNGASSRMQFTPTDSLYISYYVKFQTGWEGSQVAYHPHMFYVLSDLDSVYSGLANNYLDTYIEFLSDIGSPYTIRPQIAIQDNLRVNSSQGTPPLDLSGTTENRSAAYCNTPVSSGAAGTCYNSGGWYSANTWLASTASVSTNAWHHIEVYFKMNSISGSVGQHDGIMQEWVDGTQVINHSDVLYRTNQDSTKKWAQFILAPYIGVGSPITQTMWIDELTVGTAVTGSTPASSSITGDSVTLSGNLTATSHMGQGGFQQNVNIKMQ